MPNKTQTTLILDQPTLFYGNISTKAKIAVIQAMAVVARRTTFASQRDCTIAALM
jgi:hypothetical protein